MLRSAATFLSNFVKRFPMLHCISINFAAATGGLRRFLGLDKLREGSPFVAGFPSY